MERNMMIAGSGGQGVMMMGKLLAEAVCSSTDLNVTFFPSYGAEQRGGTANCYVVISDEAIGAPLGDEMDEMVVMNDLSLDKFLQKLVSGGTLFINSTIVKAPEDRDDITVIEVPATQMALELGSPKVLNIIMLGVYIGYTGAIDEQLMLQGILQKLAKKPRLIPLNEEAFAKGLEIGKACRQSSETR